jgi:hypothetical protein
VFWRFSLREFSYEQLSSRSAHVLLLALIAAVKSGADDNNYGSE